MAVILGTLILMAETQEIQDLQGIPVVRHSPDLRGTQCMRIPVTCSQGLLLPLLSVKRPLTLAARTALYHRRLNNTVDVSTVDSHVARAKTDASR